MTDVYRRMKKDENDDSPAKCRDRRRRRIEMRRLAAVAGDASLPPSNHSRVDNNHLQTSDCVPEAKRVRSAEMKDFPTPPSSASSSDAAEAAPPEATAPATLAEPVFGTMSLSGRSREMEDAVAVRMRLCLPEICRWQPVHFFAVYDGHGGSHVAELCRERMHVYVEEELMRVCDKQGSETCGGGSSSEEEEWWRTALKRCFNRMDETALNTCPCGSAGYQCGCHPMEAALAGSTAVVAILTPEDIIVANCGDSRAVLSRGGRAVPLSSDHKPDRSDELARIKSAGGRVIFVNGARVEGILAMSRAIGDKYLKPIVTSEPEVSFTKRDKDDECLILASDGLWDVVSSDLACEVACKCLREGRSSDGPRMEDDEAGALYPSHSALAAALLTRLALGRRSSDNISVIVIDLKRGG